jgi:Putative lumazine-binding
VTTTGRRETAARGVDEDAVRAAALDYFEGWFEGDVVRMDRALHGRLSKASLADQGDGLDRLTKDDMVEATSRGVGRVRKAAVGDPRIEVEVVDVYGSIASVLVRSALYHEYLHLVRTSEGWRIANALWQWT